MQWPQGSRAAQGFLPYRFGTPVNSNHLGRAYPYGGRFNAFIGETFARTASVPDGYAARGAYILPIKAGGMSSWQASIGITGTGAVLAAVPLEGTSTISIAAGVSDMSLITSLSGTATFGLSGTGSVALTIGLGGTGSFSIAGSGSLSMIIPLEGMGTISLSGSGDLKGILGLEGSFGGVTPLSPEGLAQAVWAELNVNGDAYGAVVTRTDKNAKLAVALSA